VLALAVLLTLPQDAPSIAALARANRIDAALSAYDAQAKKTGPDPAALAAIARGSLQRDLAAHGGDPLFVSAALQRLASAGDAAARERLVALASKSAGTSDAALAPLAALASLGDDAAAARLGAAVATTSGADRVRVIRLLRDAGARAQAKAILPVLDDPDPQLRGAAAQALGALHDTAAVAKLKDVFLRDSPIVKISAGAALKRLGDPSADAYLADLMKNAVVEIKVLLLDAYRDTKNPALADSVQDLLSDKNPQIRVQTAEALACCNPDVARSTLMLALRADTPSLRTEAAAAFERSHLTDARAARLMLGDESASVRLHGAGGAIALAKAPASARPARR